MPSVSDLLTTIKDLSLVGAGDSADDARVLRYLNLVYKEVYRRIAASYPTLLLSSENVTITSGAGVMSSVPFKVEFVKDTANDNTPLEVTTLPELEDENPALDATGNPNRYYFTSSTAIATYPTNSTMIRVRFVPSPDTLVSGDAESAIKLPPAFHDVLVWGVLFYMAFDERDKLAGNELTLAQSKYEIALADFMSWLTLNQPRPTIRTKAVLAS